MWPFLNKSFLRAFIKCSDGGFLCYTLYFKHFVLNCTFYFKRKSKKYPCFLWSFPFKCCSYRRMKCNIVIKFWICVCGGGQYMWFTRWLHTESLSSFACCFSKTDSLYTAIHEPLALSLSLSHSRIGCPWLWSEATLSSRWMARRLEEDSTHGEWQKVDALEMPLTHKCIWNI